LRSKTEIIYKEQNYINYEEDVSLEWIDFDEAVENTGKLNFYFYLVFTINLLLYNIGCKESLKEDHDSSNCLICVQKLLYSLNMHSTAYTHLYRAYEYIVSLSVTQVNCERAFSKLKIIKNRLRSSMKQKRLEAFMIMSSEKEVLENVNFEDVLDILKQSSALFNKLLSI